MNSGDATDEVVDIIAYIEMQRQEIEKTAGRAASSRAALRKLHELLDQEKATLHVRGPGAESSPNVEAVLAEIGRVKKLAAATGRISPPEGAGAGLRHPFRQGQQVRRNASRKSSTGRGRRTMERRGGRPRGHG
jgi:hypothetical protein